MSREISYPYSAEFKPPKELTHRQRVPVAMKLLRLGLGMWMRQEVRMRQEARMWMREKARVWMRLEPRMWVMHEPG
jgi:hypothetical protein